MSSDYLTDIIILLTAAIAAVPLFRALALGAVPGLLIAGIMVGPSGLGLIDNVSEIGHFAEFGVVLLLFVIGIELKPSRLWLMRRLVFGLGTLQVLVTGLLVTAVACFLLGISLRLAILIGPALALSSTAFVLQLLTEQKMLATEYGRTSVAVLLLQDLAVVPLLALVSLLAFPDLSVGEDIALAFLEASVVLVLVILGGRYFFHPVLHWVARSKVPEIFTASAVLLVLGTAAVTEYIGLSMAMGAFIAGLLIAESAYRHQVMAEIQPFRGLLLGLFFMSMGMSLNLGYFLAHPVVSVLLVVALMLSKAAVMWGLAGVFGLRKKTGLAVALILAQSGEFALVVFALARQTNLLDEALFQQLLVTVLLSMLATSPIARLAQRLARWQGRGTVVVEEKMPSAPIVILGFGRVGHRIGQILEIAEIPYLALDHNSSLVAIERGRGHPVFFGDTQKPEILKMLGAGETSLVIVTLDDFEATERAVTALRQLCPGTAILARGANLQQCRSLHKLGAKATVSENLYASLELARSALDSLGHKGSNSDAILEQFRRQYYAQIENTDASQS
ncbi:MAG: monovalent cation:proton antiporter-2 (CPA2) family protein [Pseudomonadota bacterium]|nr:monovalent cation:proton antiporter-2 (CPA2) family protein [Pseudomonadota bacterium]